MMFAVTAGAVLVAMALAIFRAIKGPTVYDRILAVNTAGTLTVVLISVYGFMSGRPDFLDLALVLDERLETQFAHPVGPEPLQQNITNPYGHISVSDGGAHTRYLTTSTWPVEFLTH